MPAELPELREQHIRDGLAALSGLFARNPRHPFGLLTRGELHLLRAQAAGGDTRRAAAQDAVAALEQAAKIRPLLAGRSARPLAAARALLYGPPGVR